MVYIVEMNYRKIPVINPRLLAPPPPPPPPPPNTPPPPKTPYEVV